MSQQNEKNGVIYILTNPSFPNYVKIGYADDIESRLRQLNNSECTPFAFRVYATYEVSSRLSDIKVHSIIDKLNPNLRAIDKLKGRQRIREFYAMSPEDAYSILEAIAEINVLENNLTLVAPNTEEIEEENQAKSIEDENNTRRSRFSFEMCGIPIGAEIEYSNKNDKNNNGTICIVVDDRTVKYDEQNWSLTGLVKKFLDTRGTVSGPCYFKYKGEWLNDIRRRLEV